MKGIKLTLNLKDGIITLNDGTLDALGRPRQVQLLVNMKAQMLVLRACGREDPQAIVLPTNGVPTEHIISSEIGGRMFLRKICQQMSWTDELTRECSGTHHPQHQAVSFDLSKVRVTETRR